VKAKINESKQQHQQQQQQQQRQKPSNSNNTSSFKTDDRANTSKEGKQNSNSVHLKVPFISHVIPCVCPLQVFFSSLHHLQ
jgi:hypothetical protein